VLLRIISRGGLARGLLRAGRRGLRAASGTLARPMSFANIPSVTRALSHGKSLDILAIERGNRLSLIGKMTHSNQLTRLYGVNGELYISSKATSARTVAHWDNRGSSLGFSRFDKNWSKANHYDVRERFVGYDRISSRKVTHYDQSQKKIGESRLRRSQEDQAYDWVASDNLEHLLDLYAKSLEFCDEQTSRHYKNFREAQRNCLNGNTSACDALGGHTEMLFQNFDSGRSCG